MKFYKYTNNINYLNKIYNNKLTAIYINYYMTTKFFKNGKEHNSKNACYTRYDCYKYFCLNGESYGTEKDFTKQSWRKFVKLKAFL